MNFCLDALNLVPDGHEAATRRIDFMALRGGKGQRLVMRPLVRATDPLPSPVDFLTAVERYL